MDTRAEPIRSVPPIEDVALQVDQGSPVLAAIEKHSRERDLKFVQRDGEILAGAKPP
jgi:hypothetical protein